MAIFPIFVGHKPPEGHTTRKYKFYMMAFISAIWFVVIMKEIIYRVVSIIENDCFESKPVGAMWFELVWILVRLSALIFSISIFGHFIQTNGTSSKIMHTMLSHGSSTTI